MKTMIAAGLAVSLLGGAAAYAQSQVESINVRESKIDRRIDHGAREGHLTGPEAQALRAEYRALLQLEASYRKSGGISAQEQADLATKLAALNAKVVGEKRDPQVNANR